jgi:hypothetical protein
MFVRSFAGRPPVFSVPPCFRNPGGFFMNATAQLDQRRQELSHA